MLSNRARRVALAIAAGALAGACHRGPPARVDEPPPSVAGDWTPKCESARPPAVRRTTDTLTDAERDAMAREAQTRRAAWRARAITDYRIKVSVSCFCPGPVGPAILEVRGGVPVGLRDTSGRAMKGRTGRDPFEPWSSYTVEGLFDQVERAAQRGDDVIDVAYEACFGYPTHIRGDIWRGLPDDWYLVTASGLAPRR